MVNKKYVLVIAFLALIALIAMPVSAYTQLNHWNTTNVGGNIVFGDQIILAKGSSANVTYMTYFGDVRVTNVSRASGSLGVFFSEYNCVNQPHCANGTFVWDDAADTATIAFSNNGCDNANQLSLYMCYGTSSVGFGYGGGMYTTKANSQTNTPEYNKIEFYDAGYAGLGEYYAYGGSAVSTPVSSFSCTPTSQYPDASVVCTDSSTNTPTDWLWSIDAEALGIDAWQTHTGQNFTWQSHYPGLYSVNLRANNSAGSDWENKSNYVSISVNATPNTCSLPLASGYSRTKFRCMNPSNDATVFGCNQQLNDVEGGSWSNQSALSDGIWCIDTLPLHHINAYGDATGYTSGSRIGVQEWNNMQYTIPLIPGYVPNATAGKVWVYIYVSDMSTYGPISGAQVSLSGNGLTTQSALTGSSGGTSLQWPNSTVAYINVVKSGYTSGSKVITTSTTGPDIAYIMLHTGTATSTLTPNPTSTGGPTALPTQDTRTTSQKDEDMMNLIRDNGSALIGLAIITTMLGLMKMWGK